MEAIILAGGRGTRLRQLVQNVPKPMALISGRPFLELLLISLSSKGFSRVVLSLGYMSEKIIDYFGPHFLGLELIYVVEEKPLGTGGAVRLALEECSHDHVFIFNGDTYIDLEVDLLEKQWQTNQCLTVVGKYVEDSTRFGRLNLEGSRISSLSEKSSGGRGLINAGCYVMAKDALAEFPLNKPFSLETDYLEKVVISDHVNVFVTKGIFIDIGIPKDYLKASDLLVNL